VCERAAANAPACTDSLMHCCTTSLHCRTKTVLSGDLTSHSSSGSYRGHSGSGRSIGAEDSWPVVKILLEPKVQLNQRDYSYLLTTYR
jgi:hypothetical protein